MDYSIEMLMQMLPELFLPEGAAGEDIDVQAHLTGEGGGDYVLMIHNQQVVAREGTVDNPNITVTASAKDALDIANERLDPMRAFLTGKVRMDGDMRLAISLVGLFRKP
mgnify:CR=1 FL=1